MGFLNKLKRTVQYQLRLLTGATPEQFSGFGEATMAKPHPGDPMLDLAQADQVAKMIRGVMLPKKAVWVQVSVKYEDDTIQTVYRRANPTGVFLDERKVGVLVELSFVDDIFLIPLEKKVPEHDEKEPHVALL